MNREIKFRGKVVHHDSMTNPDDGWVYGFYDQDLYNGEIKHYIISCPMIWRVIPETVSQYTGLKDKNGKEIYEGDILVSKCLEYVTGYLEVLWSDEVAAFLAEDYNEYRQTTGNLEYLSGFDTKFYTICGNIHDNPELLKTE